MIAHLFRNHWYRAYFQLLDSFGNRRCGLCWIMSQKERELIAFLLQAPSQRKKSLVSVKTLCVFHKSRVKKGATEDRLLLPRLKALIGESLRKLAHPPRHPAPRRSRWFRRSSVGCAWCRQLSSEERILCRALIQCLDDTEFWKGFQKAPLLCLDHLEKCLAVADQRVGFKRLLNDQSAKLNELLDDLIRFEATGTHGECESSALDWLAGLVGPSLDADDADLVSSESDVPPELISETRPAVPASPIEDPEALLFEKEKLTRKVQDLLERLSDLETSAAALQYRVARLSEDNRRLEMGYTGANTQADGLKQLVRDLKAEIAQLKNGGAERTAKAAS